MIPASSVAITEAVPWLPPRFRAHVARRCVRRPPDVARFDASTYRLFGYSPVSVPRIAPDRRIDEPAFMNRPYADLARRVPRLPDRTAAMHAVCDLLWDALHPTGVSWVGFYLHAGGDEMVLGPRRDKPACSPIGLHGACGQALRARQPLVVPDVKDLGESYIACDPRDRSEVVVPLIDADGACRAVLDLDSHELAAFNDADAAGLQMILRAAGLTT
jgi:L-methionine (R)-S-oxide reductase